MYKVIDVFLIAILVISNRGYVANLSSITCGIVSELNLLRISMNALPS